MWNLTPGMVCSSEPLNGPTDPRLAELLVFSACAFSGHDIRLVLEWLSAPSSRCSLRNGVRLGRARGKPHGMEGWGGPILDTCPGCSIESKPGSIFQERRGANDADDAGFRVFQGSSTGKYASSPCAQCSGISQTPLWLNALNPTTVMPVARIVVRLIGYCLAATVHAAEDMTWILDLRQFHETCVPDLLVLCR